MPHTPSSSQALTIMFEHCTDQPYYPDTCSPSGRSSPANSSSPSTPVDLYPHSPLDLAVASEDSWNLIPYDVPWGPEYYRYRAGTLPGPDGTCIFLRSPTPLKNRRTQKACNKCRQRKAKCSGTRPACTRCLARGYICEYVEEDKPEKRVPVQPYARPRYRERREREGSTSSSDGADASCSVSDCESYQYSQAKSEEPEPSTPGLLYADVDSNPYDSPADYASHWDDSQYSMAASYGYEHPAGSYCEGATLADYYEHRSYHASEDMHPYHPHDPPPIYHELADHRPASGSLHAPRPVRCTGSPSFLSPAERSGAFAVPPEAQGMQNMHGMQENDMLINLAAAAEPTPQIAIPQVPPMAPTEPALEPGQGAVAVEYAQGQELYYYSTAEPAMQYPYMHYQYAVPAYPQGGMEESISPAMLYTIPMLSAGMTA